MGQAVAMQPVVSDTEARPRWRPTAGLVGTVLLLLIAVPCFVTLPWSVANYDAQNVNDLEAIYASPSVAAPFGTDELGRSLLWRCLMGGAISLTIGIAAAGLALCIGVTWGALAGYFGGRIDSVMMRIVDIVYGLPYILMVVLLDLALSPVFERFFGLFLRDATAARTADIVTLLVAIGGVSWLTMARVIRGQVLSLRAQPFIEATSAMGMRTPRVLVRHLLPNLVGPIVVYATLAVPQAILQESFLSFLGIGVRAPLPSWGNLAAAGVNELPALAIRDLPMYWWLLVWPCALLGLTLLGLNFLGDALRERFDPKGRRS